ncbi:DUF934 domain-containing protein [Reinekea marinisedimentorum]|uniref:Uncharacterized protein (DUF934 family) n=1 Tax=Reinekea marinisedimentorum TaxID=230495 RepID=A0A4R3IBF4_9GAMM|nr:DUF934 domain-containing protein [Reinekea marinisedimentorum]TCS42601.1 uncharacterized protein (DUF934 family) [Reinekea marinisedimentorum]
MPKLVKNNQAVESDGWIEVDSLEAASAALQPLIPLSLVTEARNNGLADKQYGILFSDQDSFEVLLESLSEQPVIVFKFGKFADGRFFTFARELREQHAYSGDIRAAGDFMPDQVAFLSRCGFTSFDCRNEAEAALIPGIKGIVSNAYQADAQQPEPLFRRK